MTIQSIAIGLFVFIDRLSILPLHFAPCTRIGNGLGVSDAWERSKADPEVHQFVR